jgi:hypothetical protein
MSVRTKSLHAGPAAEVADAVDHSETGHVHL